jgi:type II secretory pathway pseudopilin PulG
LETWRRLLTLILIASAVSGCGSWSRITDEEQRAQEQAQQLSQIQQACQRFADGFAGKALEYVSPTMKRSGDLAIVDGLSYWQITQLNSAYTIATGPSPILCHLDLVVLATLSRMVVEDTLVELDDDLLQPLGHNATNCEAC